MCGLWEPIPHRGILPEPRHTGVDIGLIPNHTLDSDDTPMEGLTLPGEQKGYVIGRALVGGSGRGGGEGVGTGIDM